MCSSGFGGTAWAFAAALAAEVAGIGLYAWSGETHHHGEPAANDATNGPRTGIMGYLRSMLPGLQPCAGGRQTSSEDVDVGGERLALLSPVASEAEGRPGTVLEPMSVESSPGASPAPSGYRMLL